MNGPTLLIQVFFFLTGATSLVLEVLWSKQLSYVLGVSVHAAATTVAAFMFGLAAGSFLISKIRFGKISSLVFFGCAQILVGLFGVLSIPLLTNSKILFAALYRMTGDGSVFSFIQFLIVFLILALPVSLMGMTLPLLSEHLASGKSSAEKASARLYAINTFGAVSGTLIAGYFLIPSLGISRSATLVGIIDVFIGVSVVLLGLRHKSEIRSMVSPKKIRFRLEDKAILTGFFLSGLAALIYEVAWFRYLSLIFGATVTAFAVMLGTFLTGIALGSFIGSAFEQKIKSAFKGIVLVQLSVAFLVGVSLMAVNIFPRFYGKIFWSFSSNPGFASAMNAQIILSIVLLLLPTIGLGMMFPLSLRALEIKKQKADVRAFVGWSYGLNTVGAIVGSLLAGFFLVPNIGFDGALKVGCLFSVLAGLVVLRVGREKPTASMLAGVFAVVAVLAFAPTPNFLVLSNGIFASVRTRDGWKGVTDGSSLTQQRVLFYRDGKNATISVLANELSHGSLGLRVSGKGEAVTDPLGRRHLLMLAHLPILLAKDPTSVGIIGFGGGMTAGSVLNYPQVKNLDIMELESAVIEASPYFDVVNGAPLKDSRTHLILQDGRLHIELNKKKYGVLTVDPVSPWLAGSSNLYSLEFYVTASQRLTPGGTFCQWIQMGDFSEDSYKIILKSAQQAFPHLALFVFGADTVLIGSNEPIELLWPRFLERVGQTGVLRDLHNNGIKNPVELVSYFVAGNQQLAAFLKNTERVSSDDNAWLEYTLPREYYASDPKHFGETVITQLAPGRMKGMASMTKGISAEKLAQEMVSFYPEVLPGAHQELFNDFRSFVKANVSHLVSSADLGFASRTLPAQVDAKLKELWNRAASLREKGDLAGEQRTLKEFLKEKMATGYSTAGLFYVNSLVSSKKYSEADAVIDELMKRSPAILDLYKIKLYLLEKLGKESEKEKYLELAELYFPSSE